MIYQPIVRLLILVYVAAALYTYSTCLAYARKCRHAKCSTKAFDVLFAVCAALFWPLNLILYSQLAKNIHKDNLFAYGRMWIPNVKVTDIDKG